MGTRANQYPKENVTSFEAHINDDSLQKGTHALSLIIRLMVHGKLFFD